MANAKIKGAPSPRAKRAWDRSVVMHPPTTPSSRFASDVMAGVKAQAWVEEVIGRRLEGGNFASSLKDGQGLCLLINTIRAGTIPKVDTSNSPFKQMANISAFLHACRKLGVREHALFETLDLYNEKRLPQVARCLFSLSETVRKTMPEFSGPHLSSPDPPDVDPAAKAVVDISKGRLPAPGWGAPTLGDGSCGAAAGATAQVAGVEIGVVLPVPDTQLSFPLNMPHLIMDQPSGGDGGEPRCLSPAAHAAGRLTYGIYEGGGGGNEDMPARTTNYGGIAAGKAGAGSADPCVHGTRAAIGRIDGTRGTSTRRDGTGIGGAVEDLESVLAKAQERKQWEEAIAQADSQMEVALWIEGVTGVTFPGKFWSSLKDGVLLCKLVNAIKPGLIPHVNKSHAPFPEMENISAFLTACRTLGLAEDSLFDTKDLHEKRDMQVVVRCMLVLGATVRSTVPNFRGPFLGKQSEACANVNARGLRKRLGKGPGAKGGIDLGALGGAAGVTYKLADAAEEQNGDDDADATATVTPAESPAGNLAYRAVEPRGPVDSVAASAALESSGQRGLKSGDSASPRPGLLARVASPLRRGTSPLRRRWKRPSTPPEPGEDPLPALIVEEVEAVLSEGGAGAKPWDEVKDVEGIDKDEQESRQDNRASQDKAAAHLELRCLVPVVGTPEGGVQRADDADVRGGGDESRGDGVNGVSDLAARGNDESDKECDDVVSQVQEFVESNTRMPWRVPGDLFESLRDGWQLGLLANSLRPGAMRRVHNSIMPPKHVYNIGNFLIACRRMGVASSLIFQVPDLYAKRNLTKVMRTLLALRALAADPDFLRARPAASMEHSSLLHSAVAKAAAAVAAAPVGGVWSEAR